MATVTFTFTPYTANVLAALSLLLFLATSLFKGASAHGMMCQPRQRGAYVSDKCGSNLPIPPSPVVDYCAHCLNGGTVAAVKKHLPADGWREYEPIIDFAGSATRAGLCGDAVGQNDHMLGGTFMPSSYGGAPIVANWTEGATVDFTAELDTNHNGYFEYFLCDLDACGSSDIRGTCFQNGHCHRLLRVPHPFCESPSARSHYECGPIDSKYPGRWYVPCRKTGHVGVHIVGGDNGYMRYRLPKGVTCKHCVVQWYWATANSCAPRGFLDYMLTHNAPFGTTCPGDSGTKGTFRDDMTDCGGSMVPEEFWSCADVSIMPRSGGSPQQKPVSPPASDGNDDSDHKPNHDDNNGSTDNNTEEKCVPANSSCDLSKPCCGWGHVCAKRPHMSSFTCTSLSILRREMKAQRENGKRR